MPKAEPQHYSYHFRFKTNTLPAAATDRFPRPYLFLGFVLGLLLLIFGGAFFINSSPEALADLNNTLEKGSLPVHYLLSPRLFGLLNLLLGVGLLYAVGVRLIRHKNIFFDGQKFIVKDFTLASEAHVFEEPLYNYSGVRLRVQFYQFGILTKNKFIIELLHKDPLKTIPLYISTRSRSLRRLWKEYAAFFKMPALKISDKGMVSYNAKNLDLPYKKNAKEWHLPENFIQTLEKPSYIIVHTARTGEKMIKIGKIFFDAYNFLATFAILVISSLGLYAFSIRSIVLAHISPWILALLLTIAILIVLYAVLSLFSSDIIILARNKIFLFQKTLFFRRFRGLIHINDLKGIDINYVPTLNRHYLALLSNQETLVFGQKMPVKDLRWLRALLIREIIGN